MATRADFNSTLGVKSVKAYPKDAPRIIPKIDPYPRRPHSLGKTKQNRHGIAGWRNAYYRPEDVKLAPQIIIAVNED